MDDIHISTSTTDTAKQAGPTPTNTTPKHQTAVDQAKDTAKKVLAIITGRTKR